jgi:hypothetical protein
MTVVRFGVVTVADVAADPADGCPGHAGGGRKRNGAEVGVQRRRRGREWMREGEGEVAGG